jgi:asparagine synthase (glutamine-hydrolysing)
MSGGLDSTSVAAIAAEQISQQFESFDLRAYTNVYRKLILDREGHYASLVAKHLNIPIHHFVLDDYKFLEKWDTPEAYWPEPLASLQPEPGFDSLKFIAAHSRVILTGEGGDSIFKYSSSYLVKAFKKGNFVQPIVEILRYLFSHGRFPPVGFRTALKKWLTNSNLEKSTMLPFIKKEIVEHLNLKQRWKEFNRPPAPVHPERPEAYNDFATNYWQYSLESYTSGIKLPAVEFRHPFFDKRLVEYLLAIPSVPWFLNKELLRSAMVGKIPEEVRNRPKAPMNEDPFVKLLQESGVKWSDFYLPVKEFDRYVDIGAVSDLTVLSNVPNIYDILTILSLNIWFQQQKLYAGSLQ